MKLPPRKLIGSLPPAPYRSGFGCHEFGDTCHPPSVILDGALSEQLCPDKIVNRPFPRFEFNHVMECYGSDKPDIRFGMELTDLSDIVEHSEFGIFKNNLAKGGCIKGIKAPECANYTKKQLDELNSIATKTGASGLLTIALSPRATSIYELIPSNIKSTATKYLKLEEIRNIAIRLKALPGDLILIVADERNNFYT